MTFADVTIGRHNLDRIAVGIADDLGLAFQPDGGAVSEADPELALYALVDLLAREKARRERHSELSVLGNHEIDRPLANGLVRRRDHGCRRRRVTDHAIKAELEHDIGRMFRQEAILLFLCRHGCIEIVFLRDVLEHAENALDRTGRPNLASRDRPYPAFCSVRAPYDRPLEVPVIATFHVLIDQARDTLAVAFDIEIQRAIQHGIERLGRHAVNTIDFRRPVDFPRVGMQGPVADLRDFICHFGLCQENLFARRSLQNAALGLAQAMGQATPLGYRRAKCQGHERVGRKKGLQHEHMNHNVTGSQSGGTHIHHGKADRDDRHSQQAYCSAAHAMAERDRHENRRDKKHKRISRLEKHGESDRDDQRHIQSRVPAEPLPPVVATPGYQYGDKRREQNQTEKVRQEPQDGIQHRNRRARHGEARNGNWCRHRACQNRGADQTHYPGLLGNRPVRVPVENERDDQHFQTVRHRQHEATQQRIASIYVGREISDDEAAEQRRPARLWPSQQHHQENGVHRPDGRNVAGAARELDCGCRQREGDQRQENMHDDRITQDARDAPSGTRMGLFRCSKCHASRPFEPVPERPYSLYTLRYLTLGVQAFPLSCWSDSIAGFHPRLIRLSTSRTIHP